MNVEIIRFLKHLTSPAVRALLFVSLATTPAAAMPTITSPEWIPGFDMLGRGNLLGGRVTFETDEAARPTVIVESATRRFVVPREGVTTPSPGTTHAVTVLGLRPDTAYRLEIRARTASGETAVDRSVTFTTPELPEDYPHFDVTVREERRMEPGLTFLRVSGSTFDPFLGGLYVAVAADGTPVWIHRGYYLGLPEDAEMLPNGDHLLLYFGPEPGDPDRLISGSIHRVDRTGSGISTLYSSDAGYRIYHHEVEVTPWGNLLTLGQRLRFIGGYPDGAGCDFGICAVVGDEVVELNPDGTVAQDWSLFDILDPHRIGEGFTENFWDGIYLLLGTRDWTHTNAIVYDPRDDTLILSCRHQDIVFKMRRDTGELVWVIGEDFPDTTGDDDWPFLTLIGDGSLPSHQHAPALVGDDRILIYDNGNATGVTRAVEYRVDPDAMTLEQTWEWIDPDYQPPLFAPSVGDVDVLPNGNVLVTDGNLPSDQPSMRVAEVDRATDDKVWELFVRRTDLEDGFFTGYRAERVPSLYGAGIELCGGVPRSTGILGVQVELENVVKGSSPATVGDFAECLSDLGKSPPMENPGAR
ncbi:MAG: aryl-sulfate sulfotransferase [Myxococcales bacterium]|nr:aryl-sulfate sulfotransferase [Myxococcales bacterium]